MIMCVRGWVVVVRVFACALLDQDLPFWKSGKGEGLANRTRGKKRRDAVRAGEMERAKGKREGEKRGGGIMLTHIPQRRG